jgi:hypothetical protein
MELVQLEAPLSVRATLGWWRAKRISAEGPLVTYEGCSTEAMATETSFLGSTYIRVLAPGVYTTQIPTTTIRSVRHRAFLRAMTRTVVARKDERERYFAARKAAFAAAASTAQRPEQQ